MPLEAGLWVGLTVLAPFLAASVWPRLAPRWGRWAGTAEQAGPWLHAFGPAYLALLRGAVLGRDFGLYGQGLQGWLAGGTVCAGALVAGWLVLRWKMLPAEVEFPRLATALGDETRWAFYRAAGMLWTGLDPAGIALGLLLAALEWGLGRRIWQANTWRGRHSWVAMGRLALSSALFLATHNFWLTVLTQTGWILMAGRQVPHGQTPAPAQQPGTGAEPPAGEVDP